MHFTIRKPEHFEHGQATHSWLVLLGVGFISVKRLAWQSPDLPDLLCHSSVSTI